ncbi:MAG: hypothetical protein RJQ09_08125 [Cyclobacteriaceae bacterium]
MKYIIQLAIILLAFTNCQPNKQNVELSVPKSEFPFVIIETEADSVRIGDKFKAKVYLSDSSYYFLYDRTGKKRPTNPVFRVNGELVDSPNGHFLMYEEVVTDKLVYKEFPNIREISFGIIFPHPSPSSGDIEIGYRHSYIATKE